MAGPEEGRSEVRYLNRELSWLDFNERVLALAEDEHVPLLERAKFLAIFSQNLDEFFQVRVAGLKEQVTAGIGTPSPDGRTAPQQLLEVRERVEALVDRQQHLFLDAVAPALAEVGIRLSRWDDLDDVRSSCRPAAASCASRPSRSATTPTGPCCAISTSRSRPAARSPLIGAHGLGQDHARRR